MKTHVIKLRAQLRRAEEWLFANPRIVLSLIFAVTLAFATQIPKLRIYTDFADLLPQRHSYIQTYNRIKENFGGANVLVVALEVKEGTVFNSSTMKLLNQATQGIDNLPGVNHNLLSSLTHRSSRNVFVTPEGNIASKPYFDVQAPDLSAVQFDEMRKAVLENPRIIGLLVSPDLKSVLIKAPLNEGTVDYADLYTELQDLRSNLISPDHNIYMTGNPVLTGAVYTYLGQIVMILGCTLALLASLLLLYFRRLYGVALPLLGIVLSSVWGVGFMALCGFNLEPLSMPIPFLIAARATSHGVQLVSRYYEELAHTHNGARAARNALDALFRPGSLAIVVDALGIAVIVLGAAPFNHNLGISAGFWAFSVIFTVHFMVPLALSVLPQPKGMENKNEGVRRALGAFWSRTGATMAGSRAILAVTLVAMAVGISFATHVHIGESEPGSPILLRNHDFNVSTRAINRLFPGTEELHIIARTDAKQGIRQPEVLHAIEKFQALMLQDSALGGVKSLPTVVRSVNRLTHNNDPRWMQLPDTSNEVGGVMFAYLTASPIPNALREFVIPEESEANMVFYFKDLKAETIETAVAHAKAAAKTIEVTVPGLHFELGGGIFGVTAAANEALHTDHMIIIPMVMVCAFLLVMAYYQSLHAGWLMVLPMLFATLMTYAFMGWLEIGVSVNTVPVIAVGVGVGIDYAVYFMDRIREEMVTTGDLKQATVNAVASTGYAVGFTAATLVAGVVLWIFMSDLRFQSDAAILLSFMLLVNALAAMLIVPAWCIVFKPRFVVAYANDEDVHIAPEESAMSSQPAT